MARKNGRHRRRRRPVISGKRYERLVERCRELPEAKLLHSKDYISNLLITVLDLRLETTTVERALEFYRVERSRQIGTFARLKGVLESGIPDVDIAIQLWGYRYGNRIATLLSLILPFILATPRH